MGKDVRKRLIPLIVTLTLLLSMIVLVPQNALAAPAIDEMSKDTDLTCGETIWINASGLNEDERYYIKVWNGSGLRNIDYQSANSDGEISITFNVPGWKNLADELDVNPLGTWNISLHNTSDGELDDYNIDIDHLYDVRYKVGNNWLDYAVYNKSYEYSNAFYFYVYNWTGNNYELLKDTVDITLYDPAGNKELSQTISTGEWNIDYTFDYDDSGNYETEYHVYVEETTATYANQTLPVKLNISATMPTYLEWGDDIEIHNGYVRDGAGNGIDGYNVSLYTPTRSGYSLIQYTSSYSTGRFSLIAPSDVGSAGTWYLGTYDDVGIYRVDETQMLNIPDFISYYSIDVDSDDSAGVKVESPDEIVLGFVQKINVSVYNLWEWDDDYYDEMWIHVTGIDAYFKGTEYDEDDVIVVHTNAANSTSSNDKYAYYTFNIKFNETGSGSIIVTHPDNDTTYEDLDDLEANLTGSTNFEVVSPGNMTVIVEDMVDEVIVNDATCAWLNQSHTITVQIFGDTQSDPMNASITIKGAGIDIEIDEEDALADGYLIAPGIYQIDVSPKTAGTVTITAENDTENVSVSKEFCIRGLSGSVTTSVGDDKEILVQSTETIIAQISNGQYAEVHLTYYDENWSELDCLNETIGDDTAGNGAEGRFELIVTEEDIEDGAGFIVVAASAGDYFMYDVIEVLDPITLYVGGNGPGNYTKIQDAINDSLDGDTVFVYNGTYYENLFVNKSIHLIGENKNTTTIDGRNKTHVITILTDNVVINKCHICNTSSPNSIYAGIHVKYSNENNFSNNYFSHLWAGILQIYSSDSIISRNIFLNNHYAINNAHSNKNNITMNKISDNDEGISNYYSNNCIYANFIFNNSYGIQLEYAELNTISSNLIQNNGNGIGIYSSNNNIATNNNISDNDYGIKITHPSTNNIIYNNTFINNAQNAYDDGNNSWDDGYPSGGNYWDDYNGTDSDEDGIGDIPYNISGGNNRDRYPLMKPFGENKPPRQPIILGHPYGKPGIKYNLRTQLTDPNREPVYSMWDWGDDSYSAWVGPFPSGKFISASHAWSKGNYEIRVKAKDIYGAESNWSDPLELTIEDETPTLNIIKPEKALYIRNRKILPRFIRKTLIIGKIDITVDAQDDSGIKKIEFYIDNILRTIIENPPYIYTWKREKLSVREHGHIIKVVALDNAGNLARDEIKVWKFL